VLRQYFPKGANLSLHSADDLVAVAAVLNARPHKTAGWRIPAETFDEVLRSAHTGCGDDETLCRLTNGSGEEKWGTAVAKLKIRNTIRAQVRTRLRLPQAT
jgi:hypothetical protein